MELMTSCFAQLECFQVNIISLFIILIPLPSLLDIILNPPLFSFLGSIVPQAFKELLRIVKVGGILAWNIADGYEGFNDFFLSYDKIIAEHIKNGDWEEVYPVKKEENMLFNDAGYTHVMKKLK